jgi:hypothetical protein
MGLPARPHSAWFQEVLDEGTAMEGAIEAKYTEVTGNEVVGQQEEYDLVVLPGVKVRCHIDGRYPAMVGGIDEPHALVNEFKKIREGGWAEFERRGVEMHSHWVWQVACVQHAVKLKGQVGTPVVRMTAGKYDKAKKRITDITSHNYTEPLLPLAAIRKRIAQVEAAFENAGEFECPKEQLYLCPYAAFHDDQVDPDSVPDVVELATVAAETDITEMRRALQLYRTQHQAVAVRRKELKAEEAELKRRGEVVTEIVGRIDVAKPTDESWKFTVDGVPVSWVYTSGYTDKLTSRKPSRSLRVGGDQEDADG